MLNDVRSDFFECKIGVRQGDNWSSFLLYEFLNDLEFLSTSNDVVGVECSSRINANSAFMYFKLFVLLYADDTVILAASVVQRL